MPRPGSSVRRSSARRRTRPSSARQVERLGLAGRVELPRPPRRRRRRAGRARRRRPLLDRARAVRSGGGRGDGRRRPGRSPRPPAGRSRSCTDGVDGLLTPPGDAGALAAALTRLAEDPDARRRGWSRRPAARRRGSRPSRPLPRRPGGLRPGGRTADGGSGDARRAVVDRHPLGQVLGLDRAAPGARALRAITAAAWTAARGARDPLLDEGGVDARSPAGPDGRVDRAVPGRRRAPLARRVPREERRRPRSGRRPGETELIDRWIELRRLHEPCFLEKSPHHLRQVSCARAAGRGDAARRGVPVPRDRDRPEPARRRVLGLAPVPLPARAVPVSGSTPARSGTSTRGWPTG